MTLRDFSLISVLYDAKEGGLYKDVYFPIIKYSLVSLFHQDTSKEYYTVDVLSEFIQNNFGLSIPAIVLKRVIETLPNNQNFKITLYSDNNSFRIEKAWDYTINIQVDEKAKEFKLAVDILEEKFSEYLGKVCHQETITFMQFISDNTDDILGYFEKGDSTKVDGKYAVVTDFMQYINAAHPQLQDIANKLFWGSVIAGFLKREDPPFTSADTKEINEYFIDTSLAMALLDLSTPIKKKYADELLAIIKRSGGVPYIHPITKLEIWKILQTVEDQQGPNINTEIASAYERRKLTPSKLVLIRTNITSDLQKIGVEVTPIMSEPELQKQTTALAQDQRVIDLARSRRFRSDNDNEENTLPIQAKYLFREVHDVYMMDFICNRRKKINRQTISFVTLNSDLIRFAKDIMENSDNIMLHPHKIVVDLWMHNSISTKEISPLTEALTRCQLLQEGDARRKLNLVSKYYNEKSEFFNPQAYKAVILSLYKKARNVVRYINEAETNETSQKTDSNSALIRLACEEAIKQSAIFNEANSKMAEEINSLKRSHDNLHEQIAQLQAQHKITQVQKDNAAVQLAQSQSEIRQTRREKEKLQLVCQNQVTLLAKYQQLEKLQKQNIELDSKIIKLEMSMQKSVSHIKYWGQFIWLVICICFLIFIIIKITQNGISNLSLLGLIPIGSFVWLLINGNWLSPKIYYHNITKEQIEYWKEHNNEYQKLYAQQKELQHTISTLQSEIDGLPQEQMTATI